MFVFNFKAITDRMKKLGKTTFNFKFTSHEETEKEVNNLKIKKASQKSDIPLKIIKENIDIISYFLHHNFNSSLSCATFPTSMKYADVIPVHKKDDKTDKENYRPINILPNLSKVYERLTYNQSILILTRYSLSFNAVFGKVLTLSIVS